MLDTVFISVDVTLTFVCCTHVTVDFRRRKEDSQTSVIRTKHRKSDLVVESAEVSDLKANQDQRDSTDPRISTK